MRKSTIVLSLAAGIIAATAVYLYVALHLGPPGGVRATVASPPVTGITAVPAPAPVAASAPGVAAPNTAAPNTAASVAPPD